MTKTKTSERNYLKVAFFSALIWIPLTRWWKPDMIPMSASDVWNTHGTHLTDWLLLGTPLFTWGLFLTAILHTVRKPLDRPPSEIFVAGSIISVFSSVTEEIAFRWLIFFGSFLPLGALNWAFFGFAGFGIPEWIFTHIWTPLANWTTLGYLEPWLHHPSGWLFGAALLSTNASFRDGHRHNGLIGTVNSWFLGMFFFYAMLTHGLLAAITIHFVYNFLIFSLSAALSALSR